MAFGNCIICNEYKHLRKNRCNTHYMQQYRENNKEKCKEYNDQYYENNYEKIIERCKQYREDNYEYYVQHYYKRKGLMNRMFPGDEEKIKAIYKEAKEKGLTVDHIRPLQHSEFCGLHVSWNLQLLPLEENLSKGNRYD